MAQTIGRNTNVNDTATVNVGITLSNTTSTTIAVANLSRTFFELSNSANCDVFVKLQAASVDDVQKGIFVIRKGGHWEMPPDNIYTGEISAIAVSDSPVVFFTEY